MLNTHKYVNHLNFDICCVSDQNCQYSNTKKTKQKSNVKNKTKRQRLTRHYISLTTVESFLICKYFATIASKFSYI